MGAEVVAAVGAAAAAALVVCQRMRSSGKWSYAMEIPWEFEEKCGTPVGNRRWVRSLATSTTSPLACIGRNIKQSFVEDGSVFRHLQNCKTHLY